VTDSMHKVRFAEPHSSPDKKRVVGGAWILGYRKAGGMGKAVGFSHHEGFEFVALIEPGFDGVGRACELLCPVLLLGTPDAHGSLEGYFFGNAQGTGQFLQFRKKVLLNLFPYEGIARIENEQILFQRYGFARIEPQ